MKLFFLSTILLFIQIAAFSQDETERVFIYKEGKAYFVRVEIPYYYELADGNNTIHIDIPGQKLNLTANLADMKEHQEQNEYTDYVAVYDFPIGKIKKYWFKKLKCKITFDYQQADELYSFEIKRFMWL